jgi:hypothetical protein
VGKEWWWLTSAGVVREGLLGEVSFELRPQDAKGWLGRGSRWGTASAMALR